MLKLLAIDIDGTLLNDQKEIPAENSRAIREAVAAGYRIVLCTGRPQSGVEPYFQQLDLGSKELAILNNGASIHRSEDWSLLEYQALSDAELLMLAAAVETYDDVHLTLCAQDRFLVLAQEVPDIVAYDASLIFTEAQTITLEQAQNHSQPHFKAVFMGEQQAIDRFQAEQGQHLSAYFSTVRSQSYIFEAMAQGITKASALASLTQELGLTAQEVMAVGDGANDLEMLAFAGLGVAMGNASPDVKLAADAVTASNNEAGLAQAIDNWLLSQ